MALYQRGGWVAQNRTAYSENTPVWWGICLKLGERGRKNPTSICLSHTLTVVCEPFVDLIIEFVDSLNLAL